jgi:hypothetical protein
MNVANIKTMTAGCCSKTYDTLAQAANFGHRQISVGLSNLGEVTKKIANYSVDFFKAASKLAIQGFNTGKVVLLHSLTRVKDFGLGHKSEIAVGIVALTLGYLMGSYPPAQTKCNSNVNCNNNNNNVNNTKSQEERRNSIVKETVNSIETNQNNNNVNSEISNSVNTTQVENKENKEQE